MATVLIVDDALFMRKTLADLIERLGHTVVGEAENGFAAVDLYFKLKPDVVTMDITMPEFGGVEAVKVICGNDRNAKIIMVSAMGQTEFIKEAILSGAKDFIVKPFEHERVALAFDKVLGGNVC